MPYETFKIVDEEGYMYNRFKFYTENRAFIESGEEIFG